MTDTIPVDPNVVVIKLDSFTSPSLWLLQQTAPNALAKPHAELRRLDLADEPSSLDDRQRLIAIGLLEFTLKRLKGTTRARSI